MLNPHDVSVTMCVGSVASAVLTKTGHIYGKVIPSCGACREFMIQLGKDAGNIEILLNNEGRTVRLIDLLPEHPKYK